MKLKTTYIENDNYLEVIESELDKIKVVCHELWEVTWFSAMGGKGALQIEHSINVEKKHKKFSPEELLHFLRSFDQVLELVIICRCSDNIYQLELVDSSYIENNW